MLERRPPVLLRAVSLTDCVRVIAAGEAGNLIVLVRLIDGLVAMYARLGSRADMLLMIVSVYLMAIHGASYLLKFETSTLRTDADPEPESGVYAVRLEEPPSSLLFRAEDLLTVTSSTSPLDLGLP